VFTATVKLAGVVPKVGDTPSHELPEVTAAVTLVALVAPMVSVWEGGCVALPGVKLKVSELGEGVLNVTADPDSVSVTGICSVG
jgi:hypothetical protein